MSKIMIKFPDGSNKKYDQGITGKEIARGIGPGLAKAALVIEINGEIRDLSYKIQEDAEVRILTFKDKEGKQARKST